VTRLSDALTAYRICARAEGKSPRTIGWVTSSLNSTEWTPFHRHLSKFLKKLLSTESIIEPQNA